MQNAMTVDDAPEFQQRAFVKMWDACNAIDGGMPSSLIRRKIRAAASNAAMFRTLTAA